MQSANGTRDAGSTAATRSRNRQKERLAKRTLTLRGAAVRKRWSVHPRIEGSAAPLPLIKFIGRSCGWWHTVSSSATRGEVSQRRVEVKGGDKRALVVREGVGDARLSLEEGAREEHREEWHVQVGGRCLKALEKTMIREEKDDGVREAGGELPKKPRKIDVDMRCTVAATAVDIVERHEGELGQFAV